MSIASSAESAETLMLKEAREAHESVARLLVVNRAALDRIAARVRTRPPAFVITCGRGSSDNAATFGKYLIETRLNTPTMSMGLSVASIFAAPVRAPEALCLAISQSGQSPDLIAAAQACRAGGAFVVALTNDAASPLAALADEVIDLCAAPERSVAATKSFIASLAGLAALTAACAGDQALLHALEALPPALAEASAHEIEGAAEALSDVRNMFVLGRGFGLGAAQEAALKLKETCAIHAEAFSAAEVRHGPMQIVGPGFPVLGFVTSDEAGDDVRAACEEFAARGAASLVLGAGMQLGRRAPACLQPILMIQTFYPLANRIALARGLDPDAPRHLSKVTRTL